VIRRTVVVALWIGAGAALLAALFWGFINTPESNASMLAVSALLAIAIVAAAAVVVNVAVLLALGGSFNASLRSGARRIGWSLVAAAPLALLVWTVTLADAWVAQRSGEISAWFIARFGWADITPLFAAQRVLSTWLRWVFLPVAALAALSSFLTTDAAARRRWVHATWHWRTLLVATLAFGLLVVLPWRAAFWRPVGLPPTWVEPAAAGLRLALVAALIALGLAIIIVTTARQAMRGSAHVKE
jgi:hypothetical protein